jgi:hypothetical protein
LRRLLRPTNGPVSFEDCGLGQYEPSDQGINLPDLIDKADKLSEEAQNYYDNMTPEERAEIAATFADGEEF